MTDEGVRLQKFLSQAGVASRRAAETLIVDGRVRINGKVASELGVRVDPQKDRVEVDGKRIRSARYEWYAVHKPRGYISTRSDPEGRPTLYELVPEALQKLFYVGRLDFNSEGLVLLTNDGDVAHRLMHPSFRIDREYDVELAEDIESDALDRLRRGVELEDGFAQPETVRRKTGNRIIITMREGRNHEVRRMFKAVGHDVRRLRRTRYGPIRLNDLESGGYRPLDEKEVANLRAVMLPRDDEE
jgi:23S rRNA pseudouridine2605 synthase